MTAFVVFSMMGFSPVTPGIPVYNIGSPVFEQVKIKLANGKVFTIDAAGSSDTKKYIQSATLNGKPLNAPWFSHQEVLEGSVLKLVMGEAPNKQWGSGVEDAPPSSIEFKSGK
jgi:putative alpha-1,2-mannosidase